MRSLRFVEEQAVAGGQEVAPSISQDIGLAPAPERNSKIEFIEFAVAGAEQLRMECWLGALGFTQAGRHRSKSVTLYRQGEVAIILNAGSDTFAHYYHHLHGLSVCALGIKVDDVPSMLNRADLFAYKRYKERTGPHEYQMPAVRAPDGSLFHLLDDRYDPALDFEMSGVGATPSTEHRAHRPCRSGRASGADRLVDPLLSRTVRTGAGRSGRLDDLHGPVMSRAAHDRRNRVRLGLTSSGNDRTVVARSLSAFAGAGVNQIAFATERYFRDRQSVCDARACRFFGFPPTITMRLRESRRSPAGDCRQDPGARHPLRRRLRGWAGSCTPIPRCSSRGSSSRSCSGRVAIERYGESNAAVRMAAQSDTPFACRAVGRTTGRDAMTRRADQSEETVFSLAHLSALDLTPPELVIAAADAGYRYVGLRLVAVTPGGPAWPLWKDRAVMAGTQGENGGNRH